MTTIKMAVACTDKGQHPWTLLGDLSLSDGMLRANIAATYGEIGERRKGESVWLDHLDPTRAEYRVHMRCPRCGRHPQLRHARAVEVLTALDGAGMTSLDLSALP